MAAPELFVSAGEVSGDQHAAALLAALARLRPDISAWGVGGPRLAAAGQRQVAGIDQLSLVGFTEVLPRLAAALRLLARLRRELARRRPAVVLLVDAPEFNLRLAAAARRLGLRVVYFITPQVWAWRPGRLARIRDTVDLALCILPFEEPFLRAGGVRAEYVGHPLVDAVRPSAPREQLRRELGLDSSRPVVALLPGSRRGELATLVPPLAGAAAQLARRPAPPQFVVPVASAALAPLAAPLAEPPIGARLVAARAWDCLAAADAAVVASGTATLETALLGTPFVVVYRLSSLSHAIARRVARVRWVSLPNLLLDEPAIVELIQQDCRPERIAAETARLLDDADAAVRLRDKCAKVKALLGPGNAAARAAAALAREAGWVEPCGGAAAAGKT